MSRLFALILTLGVLASPHIANARGWTIVALGVVDSIQECQTKAEAMFNQVGATIPQNQSGDHFVAYVIKGLDIDAAVACAKSGDGRVTATLSMHTWTTDSELDQTRFELSDEMFEAWE